MESLSITVLGSEFHTAGAEQRNARFARVVLDDGWDSDMVADRSLPAEKAIAIRKRNFLNKFCVSNNELCKIFTDRAKKELATLLAYI